MDTKSLRVEIKDESQGLVRAVFSTFNVIDSHKDVTRPGAFEDGAEMPISSYGHTSWDGALPVGKGSIRSTPTEAIFEGQFFLETTGGRDTFTTVKELGALGQWSYGYDAVAYEFGEHDGQKVRFLTKQLVHEVSPVLVGAGVGTRTLSAKSGTPGVPPLRGRALDPHDTEVVSESWDGLKASEGLAADTQPSDLQTVYAWVDADGDPEAKSSYRFAHHHGVGGPANVRACLMGIASLNDVKGGGIPDADRKGVYEHLAGHLHDADIEAPELKSQPGGLLKFNEEGHSVLAAVSSYIDRAQEVMALRARKGRGMSPSSVDLLSWIGDDVKRLNHLLSAPAGDEDASEELASSYLRSIASVHGI